MKTNPPTFKDDNQHVKGVETKIEKMSAKDSPTKQHSNKTAALDIKSEEMTGTESQLSYFDAKSEIMGESCDLDEETFTSAMSVEIQSDKLADRDKPLNHTVEKAPVCDDLSCTDDGSLKCDMCDATLSDEDSFIIHQTNYYVETKFKSDDQISLMQKSESLSTVGDPKTSQATKFKSWMLSHRKSWSVGSRRRRIGREDNSFKGRLLTICPAEELEFFSEDGVTEMSDSILLKNSLSCSVAYIIKTTSPEHYAVRPCSGYIKPGSDVEVMVHLLSGYEKTVHLDKFLIVALKLKNESFTCFADLWKDVQKDSIMEHRLSCKLFKERDSDIGQSGPGATDSSKQGDTLPDSKERQSIVIKLLLFMILILGLLSAGLYWYLYEGKLPYHDPGILAEVCAGDNLDCLYGVCTHDCH